MPDHESSFSPQSQLPDPIQLTPEAADPGKPNRDWVIGAVILGLVVLLAVGSAIAYRILVGEPFAAARAIPPDADFVVSFDLLQVRDTDRLDRLVNALAEPLVEAGEIESADFNILERIDEQLTEEVGITLAEDVVPWIGRSISIAAWVPADYEDDAEALLSMAVRDATGAAAFIEKILDRAAEELDVGIERSILRNGDSWTVTDAGETALVIWLEDDVLLMGPTSQTIDRALDAREGKSLLDESAFSEVVAELPSDRLLTLYLAPDLFESLADLTTTLTGEATPDSVPTLEAIGVGFTLRDDGIQFDVAQVLESATAAVEFDVPTDAVSLLPAETIGYFAFTLPEGVVDETALDSLRSADPFAYESLMEEAEKLLGVDLFDELLPAFAGDFLLAVIETRTGMIAEQSGVPLGVLGVGGVVDRAPVGRALDSVEERMAEAGFPATGEDPTIVMVDGREFAAYTLADDALVIGSPAHLVTGYTAGDGGLTDSSLYKELDEAMIGDGLLFFVDLERALALGREFGESVPEYPVRGIGAAGTADGPVSLGSMLILIDY